MKNIYDHYLNNKINEHKKVNIGKGHLIDQRIYIGASLR
jgi:hypothetical protein